MKNIVERVRYFANSGTNPTDKQNIEQYDIANHDIKRRPHAIIS